MSRQSVEAFAAERLRQNSTGVVPKQELWDAYTEFCGEQGFPAVGGKIGLGHILPDVLGFDVMSAKRTPDGYDSQVRVWVGFELIGED